MMMEWATALLAFSRPASTPDAVVAGTEVGVDAPSGGCRLREHGPEPAWAFAYPGLTTHVTGLVVARAHPRPGRQALGRAEAGHVHPGLGHDGLATRRPTPGMVQSSSTSCS